MRSKSILLYIGYFFIFYLLQVLLFLNFSLFDTAFCFVYVGFILILPYETPPIILMAIAFLTGLSIDMFYDTPGVHASSTVLIAFLRPYLINLLTPKGGYEHAENLSVRTFGFQWYLSYAALLIFIHHLTLFLIESFGFSLLLETIGKAVFSTIFTLVTVILLQYLVLSPSKK